MATQWVMQGTYRKSIAIYKLIIENAIEGFRKKPRNVQLLFKK